MTVQELFKKVPFDDFFEAFCRYDSEFYSIMLDSELSLIDRVQRIEELKEALRDGYDACINEPAVPSPDMIFVIPCVDSGFQYLHPTLILEEDLHKSADEATNYAFEFEPTEIILGYQVASGSLYALEEADVAYAIFDELSFFGLPCSTKSDNEKTKIKFEIDEAIKEVEQKGAENCGVSVSELFSSIGFVDERTEKQKEFDLQCMIAEHEFFKKNFDLQYNLTITEMKKASE